MSVIVRKSAGKVFQCSAPATEKALRPKRSLVGGMSRSREVADLAYLAYLAYLGYVSDFFTSVATSV